MFAPKKEAPKIKIATPKLAPELIPKTKGPANGFLKRVCINNPLIDNPEPTIIAVIALGNRWLKIIAFEDSFSTKPSISDKKTCFKGIYTDPKLIFIIMISISVNVSMINVFLYDFVGFTKCNYLKMSLIFRLLFLYG